MKPPTTPLTVAATIQANKILPGERCITHEVSDATTSASATRAAPKLENAASMKNPTIVGNRSTAAAHAIATAAV
jgi:hypothetical protein